MTRPTRRALLALPVGLAVAGALPTPALAHGDPFANVLGEEHAAVYLYGIVTPRLPAAVKPLAREIYDMHREHRDTILGLITAARGAPSPARPAYELPLPLDNPGGALAVAIAIENALTAHWRDAVGEVEPKNRELFARGLSDVSVALAKLRYASTRDLGRSSSAFPGRSGS